ncbi:MAG: VWA domain-containing protein [Chloroflexi bacterium]|nr:VWA domain-containing protein [Chloroflexota bacterium]
MKKRSAFRTAPGRKYKLAGGACAVLLVLGVVFGGILIGCMVLAWLVSSETPTPAADSGAFELAYSPEKDALMQDVVARFNRAKYKTPSGQTMTINAVKMEAADIVDAARAGRFTAISPDSSLWLAQIDAGRDRPLAGESTRFAVTPIVIAMWSDAAQSLGYPQKQFSWQDLLTKAKSDPNFRWSHPSTSSASGLLTTLAEFYAGAGKTRNLTEDDVKNPAALEYVAALERTVRYYGEGEQATIDQVLAKGRDYLDAFVVSERMVIFFNSKSSAKLTAIYPSEGTLWQDHPLALLEQPNLTDDQRVTYRRFRDFLLSPEIQKLVLQSGYRPVDLNLRLDDPASPIKTQNGVDPAQPQTTLQMPNPAVIAVVQSSWYLAKRPANIYLVVDTSGSMEEQNKIGQVKDALNTFLDQIQGDRDRVGMVPFANGVSDVVALQDIGKQRTALKNRVNALRASGRTALLDGVAYAYDDLQQRGDKDRINAIVVMTDGIENASSISLSRLTDKLKRGNQTGVPVVIFSIAYGSDADLKMVTTIAEATGGFARTADTETIRKLYKILSTYF